MSEERDGRRVVHIVGAGGVGFWLAVGLARSTVNAVVYDDDTLEGGLGHLRLPNALATTKKVDLLQGFWRVNFGGQLPAFKAERFSGKEVNQGDLIVDCSDMPGNVRKRIWREAEKRGGRCLRVSYDGRRSTVVVAEGLPLTGNDHAAGYASVPSLPLSLLAGGLGGEVLLGVLNAEQPVGYIEYQVSVADIVRPVEGEVAA